MTLFLLGLVYLPPKACPLFLSTPHARIFPVVSMLSLCQPFPLVEFPAKVLKLPHPRFESSPNLPNYLFPLIEPTTGPTPSLGVLLLALFFSRSILFSFLCAPQTPFTMVRMFDWDDVQIIRMECFPFH